MTVRAINWNRLEDEKDLEVWNRLTVNFWLPEKVPLSNDVQSWATLRPEERELTIRVFTGLTLLDTIQNTVGAPSMLGDALTLHEEAVLSNISFMEAVHARSYSSIFSTLCSTREVDEAFRWAEENPHLQAKALLVLDKYRSGADPLKRKIASVFLESFLFYSGFYLPMYWSSRAKLTNTADLIRLIIRDECLTVDHDLLTPNGWKPVSQITMEDQVAEWRDDGTIAFVTPVALSSHVAESTWLFESEQGHVRQHVSPRHRMVLERRGYGKGSNDYALEITEAENLAQSKLNGYARFINAGAKVGGRDSLTDTERLLIAISADGSFDTTTVNANGDHRRNGTSTGFVPCNFSFSKQRKIDRIHSLAASSGWELRETSPRPANGNVATRRQFKLMVPVEIDRSKRLDCISGLDDVSASWCRQFIEELAEWDGHRVKSSDRITWGSVISENADYVQAVCALAGYRSHRKLVVDKRSTTYSDYHRIQINKHRRTSGAHAVKKIRQDAQVVYGVQVPSSYLLTRNGGSVSVTGNCIHGYYIGYKFQRGLEKQSAERQQELKDFAFSLILDLYDIEVKYTAELYDGIGLTEDVKAFLHYNANKALQNLGYEALFPPQACEVNPAIMAALSPDSENHDFFSGSGSSYVIGKAVATQDEDWDF